MWFLIELSFDNLSQILLGARQKVLNGFFPLRGGGTHPFRYRFWGKMSKTSFFGLFFWQNDYLLRGRGRGIPLVEKIRLVVFDRLPINRKACPGYCSVCCRLGYLYSDQLFNCSTGHMSLWLLYSAVKILKSKASK